MKEQMLAKGSLYKVLEKCVELHSAFAHFKFFNPCNPNILKTKYKYYVDSKWF
jgi:hypothetical protein